MDIRIITQGGVLGNRATRRGGGGRVQNARAGPSRFPSFLLSGYLSLDPWSIYKATRDYHCNL